MANKLLRKIGMGMTTVMVASQLTTGIALAAPEDDVNETQEEELLNGSIVASGTWGENVTYTLDSNGVLKISGTGDMSSNHTGNYDRDDVKRVVVEKGITSIGHMAFWHHNNLEDVQLPDGLERIEAQAFGDCDSLKSIVIPDSVTEIKGAFHNCDSLTSVTLPKSLITLKDTFEYCDSLSSVTLPNGVKSIDHAFTGSSITKITIPGSVEKIDGSAFSNCKSLKEVVIQDGVKEIGITAFSVCTQLESIEIPGSVELIEQHAFYDISGALKDVYYHGSQDDWNQIKIESGNVDLTNANIHYLGKEESNDGLRKDENGKFHYYKNGVIDTSKTGYVDYEGSKFYVKKGDLDTTVNGVMIDGEANPLVWYFCSNGQVQTQHVGLAEYDGAWFYIENGKVATDMNAFVDYNGGKFAVGAGRIIKEYSGLMQDPQNPQTGDWYYFADGQAQTQYTGLAMYDDVWFYVVNGKLAQDYTGNVDYDGSTFYVENGMVK